jgi:hypothetical protein
VLAIPKARSHQIADMNNPDQDTLIRVVEDARRILGEYIEPGPRDAVERLLAVLDRNDVVHALDRIKRRGDPTRRVKDKPAGREPAGLARSTAARVALI